MHETESKERALKNDEENKQRELDELDELDYIKKDRIKLIKAQLLNSFLTRDEGYQPSVEDILSIRFDIVGAVFESKLLTDYVEAIAKGLPMFLPKDLRDRDCYLSRNVYS